MTQRARRTIAVVSDGYLDSPAASAEWGAAWSPRVMDGERRLLVARVTDRSIPGLLGQLVPIDLVGRSPLAARALLLAAVRGEAGPVEAAPGRTPSTVGPVEGGEGRSLPDQQAIRGEAVFPGELPVVWNVPRPSARFVGRARALGRLDEAMSGGGLVAVTGLAGVGKSSLAVEYVHRQRMGFDAVWWVPAGRPELVGERVRVLAPALGLPRDAEPAAVLARLDAADGRWLLVLDDAAGPVELPGWLRTSTGAGRILVTSRADDWEDAGVVVPPGPLERSESVALLADRLPAVDRAVAGRIAGQLGDHPLALDQAAHRIRGARAPAETYLAALIDRPAVVLGQGEVPGRPGVTAATLWAEPLRRLDADAPAAGELLRLAAHGDVSMPLPLLTADPEAIGGGELRAAAADPFDLAERNATDRERLLGPDHPDTLTSRETLARAYQQAGHIDHVQDLFAQNLTDRHRTLGPDHPATLESRHRLGAALDDAGRGDVRPTLTDRERLLGADHPDALNTRHQLAATYRRIGATGDALAHAEPTLAARERVLGADHPQTLDSRHQLGLTYRQAGRVDEATRELRQALAGRERVLGGNHPSTLDSTHAFAKGEVRSVPLNPRLVAILRRHVDTFGVTADGRLFRSGKDGPVKAIRYLARWRQAREIALTPAEQASPLARRPYHLRHAAVSGWLNAGVPVTQVVEWAGRSVRVCLLVYAKCISGQDEAARRRIDAALAAEEATAEAPMAADAGPSQPRLSHSQPETAGLDRAQPDIVPAVPEPPPGPELEL